ncbi:MAG: aquaporin [Lachnospiraceae bacterium]|nr:aquaporin [Lachnospiraceae bacterium]
MKKFIAELIGTCVLVTFGCGTAMITGCEHWGGYLLTALAFGLVIVGMAYCVGNISGCHINPAVSLAVFLNKGMSAKDFGIYVLAQCLGAWLGGGILALIFGVAEIEDKTGAFGSNGLAGVNGNIMAGLIVEVVLTYVFVLVILGVTSQKANHGSFGGLIIGLTLVLIHIFGIALTGTSVNPARSFGPALVSLIAGVSQPMKDLWIFIVGPLAGGALAAGTHILFEKEAAKKEK